MFEIPEEGIPLDKIDIHHNVRKEDLETGINELAKSIEKIGLQQPVTVFKKNNRYQLIIGQRRFLAFKRLGKTHIPAIITEVRDDEDAMIKSFSENIHRLDLSYPDKNRVAKALYAKYNDIDRIADELGVAPQTVRNYLGWDLVPEAIQKMVTEEKKMGANTAIRISRTITDPEKAIKIAQKISETHRSSDKIKLLETARENPEKTSDEIISIASKVNKKITIYVTPRIAEALTKATDSLKNSAEGIVTDALEEWLTLKGFIK